MPDETRIVTVLFVDLVDSTPLAVRLGDDATDRLRRRYFTALRDAIRTYGGEEITNAGDGMIAAFEGTAVDAVRCAVAMQQGVAGLEAPHDDIDLTIRIGVSVGEVAATADAWQGMPLVEAARLESAAEPGQILVTDIVRTLVGSRGGHRFNSVGRLELKGLAEPLAASEVAWDPVAERHRLPVPPALSDGDTPPLAGHDDELGAIRGAWRRAVDGETVGLAITDGRGNGNAPLLAAVTAAIRADDPIVLHGRSGVHPGEPLEPLAEALSWFVASATPDQARSAVGPYGPTLATLMPMLRGVIAGLDDRVESSPAEIAAAVRYMLQQISAIAPVLLVFEDLDRTDGATRGVIGRMLATPCAARLLVLCCGRHPLELPGARIERIGLDGPPEEPDSPSSLRSGTPAARSGARASPTLVGRTIPFGQIGDAVRSSATGQCATLLVSGEAGMGKTTLIRSALDEFANDAVIGWGTCWAGDGAPAFWPWSQALDDLVRTVGPATALEAAGSDRGLLSALIREMGEAVESHDDPERHRLLILDATVRWLETIAARTPVIVVLDDLQWADPSTLDLLDHLVATPSRAPVLVLGAFRHDELDERRSGRVVELAARTRHLRVEGMDVAEVEELIGPIVGAERAAARAPELHRRTGGHPLFVSELARLEESGSSGALPVAVKEAVARRLRTLPDPSRELLDVGSVLGNRLMVDVLAHATERRPGEVIDALEVAADAGVVRADGPTEFWFAHDLFRETLYGELRANECARLHGRIGAALEARSARGATVAPGDVARHFTVAMALGEVEPAVRWARAAALEERTRSAFVESAAHLHRVRQAVADSGWTIPVDTIVGLLLEEADDVARAGTPDDARGLLATAAAMTDDPVATADIALAVQRLGAKWAVRRDEIIAQLEAARDAVEGIDPIRLAKLTAALARELQHSVAEDRVRAGPLSELALELGRESGDDETLAACLLARHDALWTPGRGAERAELAHEIVAVATRLGDTDRLAEGLVLEANGLLEACSPGYRPVLDRWFELMEERDEPHDRYMVLTRRAAVALIEGRGEEAARLMDDAAAMGEQIREPDTGNVFMSQRVPLSQVEDEPDGLRTLARDAVAWWTQVPVLAHAVAAGAYAVAGDLDDAAREVATVQESGGWRSESSYIRCVLLGHLAEAATILGDTELCREMFEEIEGLVGSAGVNGAVVAFAGPFAYPAAILAAALGHHDRAGDYIREAKDAAQRLGATVWIRRAEEAELVLATAAGGAVASDTEHVEDVASASRTGRIWTFGFAGERGSVNHVKGIGDIIELVRHPSVEIPALQLAGGGVADTGREEVVDRTALEAYRLRLADLDDDLDQAALDDDLGRVDALTQEKEQLLEELRRVTGLGGSIRTEATAPAEKARKAVSARIRDAIRRLEPVVPTLAAHLDRTIRTGTRCVYERSADDLVVRWQIED